MQVSCPVVLPAAMGFDIMEILQQLTSLGIRRLSLLTNKLMPLEDITGKMLQQLAEDTERKTPLHQESFFEQHQFNGRKKVEGFCAHRFFSKAKSSIIGFELDWEYGTLEDLAPLAMNKIDAMSIEGLRIQSGLSEDEAPSSISFESAKLHQLDAGDGDSDADGLLALSITLEEWLRLDSGSICKEDQVNDHTIRILAAHHAKCIDFNGGLERDTNRDKALGEEHGFLGNNLTVELKILLRDPLRNYEPVGTPMLALIQVERAFSHPIPEVYGLATVRSSNEEDNHGWIEENDRREQMKNENEEGSLWFKITEVYLSGLNTEPGKTQLWGTKMQQQSGNRWLVASGMSKSYKQPFPKSKAIVVAHPQLMRKVQASDILWSISSQFNSTETNREGLAGFVPHVRNPNIIFPR